MRIIKKDDMDGLVKSGKAKSTGKHKTKKEPKERSELKLLREISKQLGSLILKDIPKPETNVKVGAPNIDVKPPEVKVDVKAPNVTVPPIKIPPIVVQPTEINFPEPSRKWEFTVTRTKGGFIDKVVAERKE